MLLKFKFSSLKVYYYKTIILYSYTTTLCTMPRRSKKSYARSASHAKKTNATNTIQDIQTEQSADDIVSTSNSSSEYQAKSIVCTNNVSRDILGIEYIKRVRGNFHQGDEQFSFESRGSQCSCNALVMLCKVKSIFQDLMPYHLDDILRNGDHLYKTTAHKLEACGQLAHDGYLENDQLPTQVCP